MLDLKVIHAVLDQMEQERGIPPATMIEAIEAALATAYKKEFGKKGQIIHAKLDLNTGKADFHQVKTVVDKDKVIMRGENEGETVEEKKMVEDAQENGEDLVFFNPEHHILLDDAKFIKKDAQVGEEIVFPLEPKDDFGRIAAQTAKQVIIQKIREAEKVSVVSEYGKKEGQIVNGTVQRVDRGNIFIDMGRATGILPFEEQIPGERFQPGERVRGYLFKVDDSPKGINLKISRSHPKFLEELFRSETPEIANGIVEIKAIAREAGARSKVAVISKDEHVDAVGAMVGQRGVRVSTVMSEIGGEKIDIIEWNADPKKFIEAALSPAKIISIELDDANKMATVKVAEDQQSLAIGKGGQNVRLAAKLTNWKIDINSVPVTSTEKTETTEVK
ncbi:MAG: transcription termination factor NusA [bacterium]